MVQDSQQERSQLIQELAASLGQDFINTIKRNILDIINADPSRNTLHFFMDILIDIPMKNVKKKKLTKLIKAHGLHAIKGLFKDIIEVPNIKISYITTDFFTHYNDTLFKFCQRVYWLADKQYFLPMNHLRTTLKCSFRFTF